MKMSYIIDQKYTEFCDTEIKNNAVLNKFTEMYSF